MKLTTFLWYVIAWCIWGWFCIRVCSLEWCMLGVMILVLFLATLLAILWSGTTVCNLFWQSINNLELSLLTMGTVALLTCGLHNCRVKVQARNGFKTHENIWDSSLVVFHTDWSELRFLEMISAKAVIAFWESIKIIVA